MAQALPRAVLDTSVLVPVWSRLLLADLATRPKLHTPVWCEWIIAETWRILTVRHLRRSTTFSPPDERRLAALANGMLLHLLPIMTFVSVVPPRDADGLCIHRGIEYITAENFVRDLLGLDPANLREDFPRPVGE